MEVDAVMKDNAEQSDIGRSVAPSSAREWTLSSSSAELLALFGAGASTTGINVSPSSSLQSTAVLGCVQAISQDMGKLPVRVQRKVGGYWEDDDDHHLNDILMRPNNWQTWYDFIASLCASLKLRGNAIAVIERDFGGRPIRLIPVPWDRVGITRSPRGWLFYSVSHPSLGLGAIFHQDDVLHIRGLSLDGYVGVSPIAAAADAVGLSIAAQQHGARLFRQGAQLGGVLKLPVGVTLSDEAREGLRVRWKNTYGGVENSHMVAVLEDGMTYEKLQMTQEEAQFLQSRKFQVIEICRIFRVPPHKVFDLERATFSNIEASEQQYINDSLMPSAESIEQVARLNLLPRDEWRTHRISFDFNALLRGDRKTRYDAHAVGLGQGFLTINEVRRMEGLSPVEGGDEHRVQLNTGPVAQPIAQSLPPADLPAMPAETGDEDRSPRAGRGAAS